MDRTQLDDLLSTAIAREVEANAFYRQVAERSANPNVRSVFAELAAEELGHKNLLEGVRRDPNLIRRFSAPAADYKVAEATALPALSVDMKPADAIALAMKKEQQAVEFYLDLAARASDSELVKSLNALANMEKGHKTRLEDVFVQIGYPEVF